MAVNIIQAGLVSLDELLINSDYITLRSAQKYLIDKNLAK